MERIRHKIARLREYLSIIASVREECMERFASDPIFRGALLHYLYVVSDGCIALAELTIKYKQFRLPQSYHEAIDILGENKVIDPNFAYTFAGIAGFRNFLAHDDENIDKAIICKEALEKMNDVETFLRQLEASIGQ